MDQSKIWLVVDQSMVPEMPYVHNYALIRANSKHEALERYGSKVCFELHAIDVVEAMSITNAYHYVYEDDCLYDQSSLSVNDKEIGV